MSINDQAPSKPMPDVPSDTIVVHSIFYTIQGEGPFGGQPSVFVRLANCNLQCPMCDTRYTEQTIPYNIEVLAQEVIDKHEALHFGLERPLLVLTGGEPMRQRLHDFVSLMINEYGWRVQIETNGTIYRELPYTHPLLTVVCSPKTHYVAKDLEKHVDAWKYVGKAGDLSNADGLPYTALDHPVKPGRVLFRPKTKKNIYLSPEDEQDPSANKRNMQAVTESCLEFGHTLSLQTHKIIGVE